VFNDLAVSLLLTLQIHAGCLCSSHESGHYVEGEIGSVLNWVIGSLEGRRHHFIIITHLDPGLALAQVRRSTSHIAHSSIIRRHVQIIQYDKNPNTTSIDPHPSSYLLLIQPPSPKTRTNPQAIQHRHPYEDIRDTALYYPLRQLPNVKVSHEGQYPSLKTLCREVLGMKEGEFQRGEHCPVSLDLNFNTQDGFRVGIGVSRIPGLGGISGHLRSSLHNITITIPSPVQW